MPKSIFKIALNKLMLGFSWFLEIVASLVKQFVSHVLIGNLGPRWPIILRHTEVGTTLMPATSGDVTASSAFRHRQGISAQRHSKIWGTSGYGSKLIHQGTADFSPCFHLPGFHFGYLFLTHSQVKRDRFCLIRACLCHPGELSRF